jgi:hypothetical protein
MELHGMRVIRAKQSYYEREAQLVAEQFPAINGFISKERAEQLVHETLKALGHKDDVKVRFVSRAAADKVEPGLGGWITDDRRTVVFVGEKVVVRAVLHECVHIKLGLNRGHGKQFQRTLFATLKWLADQQPKPDEH